jgi:hypothetical protein
MAGAMARRQMTKLIVISGSALMERIGLGGEEDVLG